MWKEFSNSEWIHDILKEQHDTGPIKDIILCTVYLRSRCIQPADKHFCSSYNMAVQIEIDPTGD